MHAFIYTQSFKTTDPSYLGNVSLLCKIEENFSLNSRRTSFNQRIFNLNALKHL